MILFLCLLLIDEPIQVRDERDAAKQLKAKYSATDEILLWDRTRVDLLSDEFAIEIDWAKTGKWAEAIGQSLYYAELTGRKPAIILLVTNESTDARYVYRCQTVCAKVGIRLFVEKVRKKH